MKLSRILLAVGAALGFAVPALAQQVNIQTGSTYTFQNSDCDPTGRTTVVFHNTAGGLTSGSNVSVTLPQAGGNGQFIACTIHFINITANSAVIVTPQSSSIFGSNSGILAINGMSSADLDSSGTAAATGDWYYRHGEDVLSNVPAGTFRNIVDNPEMQVQQRGTSVVTCGTTAIATANYSADRWACNSNASGTAGRAVALTASLPTGLNGAQEIYRNGSDTHLQPVCMMQEIASGDSNNLAGQRIDLSVWLKANSALSAAGSQLDVYVWSGTTADQGLGTFTASPALTPAWAGITQVFHSSPTITTSWVRYDLGGAGVATNAQELAVAFCFTPVGTAGTTPTDGFNFTGVQITPGTYAQPFEQRTFGLEVLKDYRYYYALAEPVASTNVSAGGTSNSTTTCIMSIPLPVAMRAVPTSVFSGGLPSSASAASALSANTWEILHGANVQTALGTPFLATYTGNTATALNLTATAASAALTSGQSCVLQGQQGSSAVGLIAASTDF